MREVFTIKKLASVNMNRVTVPDVPSPHRNPS